MNFTPVEAIANAVLFEGYMLYPYRPSALKNRQRWNFGTLYPRAFAEAQNPPERFRFSAQILLEAEPQATLSVRLRFLQLTSPSGNSEGWEEGFSRSRTLERLGLAELQQGTECTFDLSRTTIEDSPASGAQYQEKPRQALLALRAESLRDGLYRLSMSLSNLSPLPEVAADTRRDVQDLAYTSAHLLVGVEEGAFVSLLEPPADLEANAKACKQDGVFPVLVGSAGDRTRVLCSPIILYDYPQVAPESAGDFFDGTEMDEMLALRVLTLTEAEKTEMARADFFARALLERTASLPDQQLGRLHGAVRGLGPAFKPQQCSDTTTGVDLIQEPFDPFIERPRLESVRVFGLEVRVGDRVRLWPQKRADILDMAMEGKIAVIEAIEVDLEEKVQFAVVLEDDPGRDMGLLRQAGHRFFFTPQEVEPMGLGAK